MSCIRRVMTVLMTPMDEPIKNYNSDRHQHVSSLLSLRGGAILLLTFVFFLQRSSNNNKDVLFFNVVVNAVAVVVATCFYVVRLPRTILLH